MRQLAAWAVLGAITIGVAQSGSNERCVRYFDLNNNTVTESCSPMPAAKPPTPSARPLSATAPDLTFPAGIKIALVEKVIDARTLQVRYDYNLHYIRMADVELPPKGTSTYRITLNLLSSLASPGSSIYFEDLGVVDRDKIDGRPVELGYFWQLRNQINLISIELGGAKFTGNADSPYFEILTAGQEWAQEKQIGVWSPPK